MKKLLLITLLSGMGLSASAMGHPHNLFSAHRKVQQYATIKSGTCPRTVCQQPNRSLFGVVWATINA